MTCGLEDAAAQDSDGVVACGLEGVNEASERARGLPIEAQTRLNESVSLLLSKVYGNCSAGLDCHARELVTRHAVHVAVAEGLWADRA